MPYAQRIGARALVLPVAMALLSGGCSVSPQDLEMSAISKEREVLSQNRVGFRLHDIHEEWGFLRVSLRNRLLPSLSGEQFSMRLRIRNRGIWPVHLDLDRVALEFASRDARGRALTRQPLLGEAHLIIEPGESKLAKLRFDAEAPDILREGEKVLARVPYTVGPEAFEIRVPFVKTHRQSFGYVGGKVLATVLLLPTTLALDVLLYSLEKEEREDDCFTWGLEEEEGQGGHESLFVQALGHLLFSPSDTPRPSSFATRIRIGGR